MTRYDPPRNGARGVFSSGTSRDRAAVRVRFKCGLHLSEQFYGLSFVDANIYFRWTSLTCPGPLIDRIPYRMENQLNYYFMRNLDRIEA